MRLRVLTAHLGPLGRAMDNICDVATPTVGGAIATATHDTSIRPGALSARLPRCAWCSPTGDRDVFADGAAGSVRGRSRGSGAHAPS
jgi:hypothetical protein